RLLSPCAGGHRKVTQSALRALAAARRPFGVRSDVQARLSCGLAAPRNVGLHPAQAKSIISPTRMYFHALRMSQSDMTTQFPKPNWIDAWPNTMPTNRTSAALSPSPSDSLSAEHKICPCHLV